MITAKDMHASAPNPYAEIVERIEWALQSVQGTEQRVVRVEGPVYEVVRAEFRKRGFTVRYVQRFDEIAADYVLSW